MQGAGPLAAGKLESQRRIEGYREKSAQKLLRVSVGGRLRHHLWTTGVPTIQQTNLLNHRRSGCRHPTMSLRKENCFPSRMRNHRRARVQEQQEPAEELRHGQKPLQTLAEPLANPAHPVWLVFASKLRLELQRHCSCC